MVIWDLLQRSVLLWLSALLGETCRSWKTLVAPGDNYSLKRVPNNTAGKLSNLPRMVRYEMLDQGLLKYLDDEYSLSNVSVVDGQSHLIQPISATLSQMWYHWVQYTKRNYLIQESICLYFSQHLFIQASYSFFSCPTLQQFRSENYSHAQIIQPSWIRG